MNDLEICKRIADIEDENVTEDGGGLQRYITPSFGTVKVLCGVYDPITDDDLCLSVIESHGKYIGKEHVIDGSTVVFTLSPEEFHDNPDKFDNKSILLAIIEARNE